jgi:ribosome-associated translation inhibitor RaiA
MKRGVMQNPLQVTFHDLSHNEEIETIIEEKFAKLKIVSPDITKCHVVLEKLSKHHQKANTACARLDLKMAHFEDIVMSEKCTEETASLKTAVLKIFKRSLALVREGLKRRQNNKRAPMPLTLSIQTPEEDDI